MDFAVFCVFWGILWDFVEKPEFCGSSTARNIRSPEFKMESTRKLSNFNFQWTKTLYQNNLKNIAFFFTFFKGLRCNKSSVVTPKKISHGSLRK